MFFQILILFVTNWETEMIQLPSLGTVDGAQHLSSRVLSPSVSIWSVNVGDCATTCTSKSNQISHGMQDRNPARCILGHENPCALGVSFLVSYILCFLNQKTGKGATWPLQLVKLGHINGDSDGTSLHRRSKVIPGSYRINHMGYMEDTLSVWKSLPCFDRLKTVDSYAARTLWDILNILRNLWVYLAKNIARVVSKKKRNTVPSWNVENHTCTLALNFIHHWSWTEGTGYFTSFLNP